MSDVPDFKLPVSRISGKAIVSLALGLLSFLAPIFLSIPGIVFGILSLTEIRSQPERMHGQRWAISGLVASGLTLVLSPLYLVVLVYYLLLAPAVAKVRQAADRVQSQNNLKQLALAGLNHAAVHREEFPPATINDAAEKPLLSWRVALLPYIDEDRRYDKFRLKEPWDSAVNRPLLDPMPTTFQDVSHELLLPHTPYRVFTGPETMFDERDNKPRFTLVNVPDGTSNTIFAVEASDAVPWSSPRELTYAADGPLPALGHPSHDYFHVAMMDGSVRSVKKTVSEKTLRSAINPADGMPLGADW